MARRGGRDSWLIFVHMRAFDEQTGEELQRFLDSVYVFHHHFNQSDQPAQFLTRSNKFSAEHELLKASFVQSNCSHDYQANSVKAFRSVCVTGPGSESSQL